MVKFFVGLAVGLVVGAGMTFVGMTALRKVAAHPLALPGVSAPAAISPEQAKLHATVSTLQTLRGNTELFKIQHGDNPPAAKAFVEVMTHKTNVANVEHADANGTYGPYLQNGIPANALNGQSGVGPAPSPRVGWVYRVNGNEYTLSAVNAAGDGVLEQ